MLTNSFKRALCAHSATLVYSIKKGNFVSTIKTLVDSVLYMTECLQKKLSSLKEKWIRENGTEVVPLITIDEMMGAVRDIASAIQRDYIGNCFKCAMDFRCRNPRHKVAREIVELLVGSSPSTSKEAKE